MRCHWAAGYSATAHNKAFFTKLMKTSYITAISASWDTPSSLPVERYQATSTDAAAWPNLDAFRNCWNAAVCGSRRNYKSSLIVPVMKLNFWHCVSNLIPPWAVGVFPIEMINSQVKHGIITPIQSCLFEVFHCIFVVVQYNPMVPAQTIQGVNWALKQGNRHGYREGTYCKHTLFAKSTHVPLLQLSPSAENLGYSFFLLPCPEEININQWINNCQNIGTHTQNIQCSISLWNKLSSHVSQNLHQEDGVVVHCWRILHLHSTSFKPLRRTDCVLWNSMLSPEKHCCQIFLNMIRVFIALFWTGPLIITIK